MNYLIDTQILIWYQTNSSNLKKSIAEILLNTDNQIFISDISLFEIVIKKKINKLPNFNIELADILEVCKINSFINISVNHFHISCYSDIRLFENHKDPFDRMIIATALAQKLTIITSDEKFLLYNDLVEIVQA